MLIALLGTVPATVRKRLAAAGLQLVAPKRSALRLVASSTPPTKPPPRPWLWCPPREPAARDVATAVMAGAYDVVAIANDDCAGTIVRRIAELSVRAVTGDPPDGYV